MLLVLAAIGACQKRTTTPQVPAGPGGPLASRAPSLPGAGSGGGGTTTTTGGDGGGTTSSGGATASKDDQQTYAYGTTDLAALTVATAEVAATANKLAVDAASLSPSSAVSDAKTLEKQAKQLEKDTGAAAKRMSPLKPGDHALAKAQKDALEVYALGADYANAAADAARAVQSASATDIRRAAKSANQLAGRSDDIATAYANAMEELQGWAAEHPADAAAAAAKYGG